MLYIFPTLENNYLRFMIPEKQMEGQTLQLQNNRTDRRTMVNKILPRN